MKRSRDDLNLVLSKSDDYQWIQVEIDWVYETISAALLTDPHRQLAAEALISVSPYLLENEEISRWYPLMVDALLITAETSDETFQADAWYYVALGNIRRGKVEAANLALHYALEKVQAPADIEKLAEIHIQLLELMTQRGWRHVDDVLELLIDTVESLQDKEQKARLYTALTLYLYWLTVQKAMTDLFDVPADEARERMLDLSKRVSERDSFTFYNREPLLVALELSGKEVGKVEEYAEPYAKILDELNKRFVIMDTELELEFR